MIRGDLQNAVEGPFFFDMEIKDWLTIVGFFLTYVAIMIKRDTSKEIRIKALEMWKDMKDKQDERIIEKLDEISRKLNRIEIELQHKQNRP